MPAGNCAGDIPRQHRDASIPQYTKTDTVVLSNQRMPLAADYSAIAVLLSHGKNRSILKLPISRSVPYHSIIGDRGKGNSPNSTDGVVPYWSSHLDGAASEKIVPSGHGANENPEGIAEIRRILLEAWAR